MISTLVGLVVLGSGVQAAPPKVWAKLRIEPKKYKAGFAIRTRIYLQNASKQDVFYVDRFSPVFVGMDLMGQKRQVSYTIGCWFSPPTKDEVVRLPAGKTALISRGEFTLGAPGLVRVRAVISLGSGNDVEGFDTLKGSAVSNEILVQVR